MMHSLLSSDGTNRSHLAAVTVRSKCVGPHAPVCPVKGPEILLGGLVALQGEVVGALSKQTEIRYTELGFAFRSELFVFI